MPLYLIESPIAADTADLEPLFGRIGDAVERTGGEVIELQVGDAR